MSGLASAQAKRLFGSPPKTTGGTRTDYAQGWTAGHTAGETAAHQRAKLAANDARRAMKQAREAGYAEGYETARREIFTKLGPLAVELLDAPGCYVASGEDFVKMPGAPTLEEIVTEMLGRADLLGQTVQRLARRTHEQYVADEVVVWERHATEVNKELGRPAGYSYRGGPVDWETGLPAGSACAWLRRQKRRQEQGGDGDAR